MQEQSQGGGAAGAPRSLTVLLMDDLADQAQVGGERTVGEALRACGMRRLVLCSGQAAVFALWPSHERRHQRHAHACTWRSLLSVRACHPAASLCPGDPPAPCCRADDVEVTGVVIRQFGPMFPGVRCQASHCQRMEGQEGAAERACTAAAERVPAACPPLACLTVACLLPLGVAPQVGLALQATSLTVANERKAAVEVTPEAAALFGQFWQAHSSCPLQGRNKVGGGGWGGEALLAQANAGGGRPAEAVPLHGGVCGGQQQPGPEPPPEATMRLHRRSSPACAPSCTACSTPSWPPC